MTNEKHAVDTLMEIYYRLCQWEHDYSSEADIAFREGVDKILTRYEIEHPDLEERMKKIEEMAALMAQTDAQPQGGVV